MRDSNDWNALRREREALLEEILALPTSLAWERGRAAFAWRKEPHSPQMICWLPRHSRDHRKNVFFLSIN
jgi:hypothetical protein